jgi:hypothetical protein
MQLVPLAQTCKNGACPAVYQAEGGDLVVQGYIVPTGHAVTPVPAGEALVRIPGELILEAARRILQD